MTHHQMNLRKEPFNKIKNGIKIVESRLYDEKRQSVKIGDCVTFLCTDGENVEKLITEVTGLLLYPSFGSMMSEISPQWFGHEKSQDAIDEIQQFYTKEDQEKYGVVGIRVQKIS